MSADGGVTMVWADGEHRFRLAIGQLRELQEKTGVGPQRLYERIFTGDWHVDDLRETIRLGLIGGGAKPTDAVKLVERYVDGRPLNESRVPAQVILVAALSGVPDDVVGKAEPENAAPEATVMEPDASASPASTARARSSDSRQGKSTS